MENKQGRLILSRKEGEEIVINGNIKITVLQIKRDGRVRLGFTAPKEIPIHRREIFDLINKEVSE